MSPEGRELLSVYSALAEEHLSAQTQLSLLEKVKSVLADRGADSQGNDDIEALLAVMQHHPEVTHAAYTAADGLIAAAKSGATGADAQKRRRWMLVGAAAFTVVIAVAAVILVTRPWQRPELPLIDHGSAIDLLLKHEQLDEILDTALDPEEAVPVLGAGRDVTDRCSRLASIGSETDYRGSGYTTGAFQSAEADGEHGLVSAKVMQAVIIYPSQRAAADFFASTADAWLPCSGSVFEFDVEGGRPERWTFGKVRLDGSRLTVPITLEGSHGLTSEHMVMVASNVVFDFLVVSDEAGQDGERIADRFLSNVFE